MDLYGCEYEVVRYGLLKSVHCEIGQIEIPLEAFRIGFSEIVEEDIKFGELLKGTKLGSEPESWEFEKIWRVRIGSIWP